MYKRKIKQFSLLIYDMLKNSVDGAYIRKNM